MDSDTDNVDHSKIEMTKAETEALDRGLQVFIYVLDLSSLKLLFFGWHAIITESLFVNL